MDALKTRPKNRLALEPTQRRIRHIRVVLGRNLTFTPCEQQRTLASVLSPPTSSAQLSNDPYSLNGGSHSRSMTPSAADLASVTSSSSKNYFRSPWRSQHYAASSNGLLMVGGPGSDTGSTTSAVSESGRRSRVREPIARLSASLKATVLSSTDLTGRRSVDVPPSSTSISSATPSTRGSKITAETDPAMMAKHKSLAKEALSFRRRAQTPEPRLKAALSLRDRIYESDNVPPQLSLPNSPTRLSSTTTPDQEQPVDSELNGQSAGSLQTKSDSLASSSAAAVPKREAGVATPSLPPTSPSRIEHVSKPQLLDSYFTLHDYEDDTIIYTSEVVKQSNNPRFKALEDDGVTEKARRRPGRLVIRIWACPQGSEYCPLLEWRMELCCLRYIGQELRNIPGSFPENTIIIGLEDGFYTAPDEDDMPEHPHLPPPPIFDPHDRLQHIGKRSYNYESVMRLNNLHECIVDTEKSRDEIKQNIEVTLVSANDQLLFQKVKGERTERLWHLQRQIGHELNMLDQAHERAEYLRARNAERTEALTAARERGRTQETYLKENHENFLKSRESLYKVTQEHAERRKEHLSELFNIYPITESEDDPNLLRIVNVPLPNSSFNGIDEETVATSLGFTCHLVTLLAYYLRVPLRYPLTPMGSRSTVLDPVSMLVGPKEFPLYGKGQDRRRFEYGVFLMNKNIGQLLNSQGLQFLDLRHTLPNIRHLSESLLAPPSAKSALYRSRFKARLQGDLRHHRNSLEFEGSIATETDDELGTPVLRVQSPDESMHKPRVDFDAPRTPSSVTDTSLSAKTSRSQSSSQLRHQLDAGDNGGYDFVEEAAQLSSMQTEDWEPPQSSSRFFFDRAMPSDDPVGRTSRLHRASTDFAILRGHRQLRKEGQEEEEDAPAQSRQRHATWDPHDARSSTSHPSLFADQHDRLAEQEAPMLGHGNGGDRSEGYGLGSDSSESTAHENSHVHHSSLSNLTPALSSKTMGSELAAGLDATRSRNTRVEPT
ncbi:hypothetical protein BGZ73_001712 [Actinomortierella ambigua]|nr:hypothetical protein BGZ73_001712 [Actinomortierella ambigua]